MMRKKISRFLIVFMIIFITTGLTTEASTIYTVQKGDTLSDIGEANQVSVDHLMEWNALHSHLIYPDQELMIKELENEYVVKAGDTLSEIAEANHIPLSTLMAINQKTSDLIYVGDRLYLTPSDKDVVQRQTKEVSHVQKQASATQQQQEKPSTSQPKPKEQTKQPSATKQQVEQKKEEAAVSGDGKELVVTATAYTAYCDGCSGTTYTGINLRANPNQKVIAVDPSIIPLGSRVWVEGYGEAIAGDIGGAIKGNKIDVFLEHKADAYQWGRKQVKIKVLD